MMQIVNLNASLHKERESTEKLRADNSAFQTSVSSRFSQFQADLAVKSKVMDEIALRTTQLNT